MNTNVEMRAAAGGSQINGSAIDPRDLRRALAGFPTGVTVVTARAPDGRLAGVTVNSFCSVSLAPLIDGTVATFECRRAEQHAGGDHLILIGEVERYHYTERHPLLFHGGDYGIPAPR